MQQLVEQERDGGRRRPVDGSDRSGLGLGRRTARRGALRARTPTQNRRAAAHATRSGARGAQKLQTAPSGRKPGTQAARRSQALAPPSRSDGAARTSAAVDRSGPAMEARDQPAGESVSDTCKAVQLSSTRTARTLFLLGAEGRWFKSSRPDLATGDRTPSHSGANRSGVRSRSRTGAHSGAPKVSKSDATQMQPKPGGRCTAPVSCCGAGDRTRAP
jgi:hypothetical protein